MMTTEKMQGSRELFSHTTSAYRNGCCLLCQQAHLFLFALCHHPTASMDGIRPQ